MTAHPALLEVCVDTVAGLHAAVDGGADRVALYAALSVGGLTPSPGMMRRAKAVVSGTNCTVRAMIRPRAGDFTYGRDDIDVMLLDMDAVAQIGLDGVIFGANLASGDLDLATLDLLIQKARDLRLDAALHRSFDLSPAPLASLEQAIDLGFTTVLTSGGAARVPLDLTVLRNLVQGATRPDGTTALEILAAGGVTPANLDALLACGIRGVHASCSAPVSVVSQRTADLGYLPAGLRDTDPALVAQTRTALDAHTASLLSAASLLRDESSPHVVC